MDTLLCNDDGDIVINQSLGALDLDTSLYNTAVGAYALRRLFGEYTGAQVRVRRSTDNAETDVYFSSDGSIQNLNLTTWLGGGTAYVRTWYDQSGNGNNVTQATADSQPILTAPSGEAAYIRFQSKIMTGPNVFGTSSVTNMHMISTTRDNVRSNNYFISLNGTNTGNPGRFFIHGPYASGTWYWDPGSATTDRANTGSNATALGAKTVFSGYKSLADNKNGFRLNGGTRFLSPGSTTANVTGGIQIGGSATDHSIYDLIIFSSKLSATNESFIETVVSETNIDTLTTLESIGALDTLGTTIYTQTVGAYALRRLFGLYAGPQVRLRRSTDNAETDVYFNINGSIQNLNLTTWLGGGTGYVTTWYDQSGNGNNVTQATTSKQPKYDTTNKIEFIASSQHSLLRTPGVLAAGDDTYTFAGVFEPHATGTQVVCEQNSSTQISNQRACVILISGTIGHNGEGNDAHGIVAYTLNQKNRFVMRVNNGVSPNVKLNHEGTNYTATSTSPANLNVSGYGFSIGYKLSRNTEYYDGFISEIIVFNTEISDIETNTVFSLI